MELLATLSYAVLFWALMQILVVGIKRLKISKERLPLPPGPVPAPIVGSLFKLGNQPHKSLAELAKQYGPLMTVKLGQVITIVVSSSAIAQQVLQTYDESFSGRHVKDAVRGSQTSESSIAWSQPNERWRKLRAVCNTRIFTAARLAANEHLRRKKVEEMIAHVREQGLAGRAVNVGQVAFSTVLNLVWNTIFSDDLVDLSSQSAQEFKEIIWGVMEEGGRPNVVDYFPVLRSIDPQGIRRRFAVHAKKLHGILDEMIERRMSSSSTARHEGRNDFLNALLDQEANGSLKLGREDIKILLADLFVAGADTSSTTVEWAMAELLRSPGTMEKAKLEVKGVIGSGPEAGMLRESDVGRLPYLQAVVKETLRLHPPVPLFPRKTLRNVEICGYMIPKDTLVTVNAWAIARDPDVWADAATFLPERFLGTNVDFKGRHFEFIPFGSGRRICPGMPIASRMVHLMLGSLLQFAWELPQGMTPQDLDMTSKFGLTQQLAKPLRAIPIPMP